MDITGWTLQPLTYGGKINGFVLSNDGEKWAHGALFETPLEDTPEVRQQLQDNLEGYVEEALKQQAEREATGGYPFDDRVVEALIQMRDIEDQDSSSSTS